jgi:hypothetical protein
MSAKETNALIALRREGKTEMQILRPTLRGLRMTDVIAGAKIECAIPVGHGGRHNHNNVYQHS